jgi:hypothetical protein
MAFWPAGFDEPLIEDTRMAGFPRAALTVAMNRAFRMEVRPPMIMRRPRMAPLSRLMGATPTKAPTRRRSSSPSSGSSAISVRAVIGPMPGTHAMPDQSAPAGA